MLNEAKLEDMITILESLHVYVPTKSTSTTVQLNADESIEVNDISPFKILFGGDQMTAAQARRAQNQRKNSSTAEHRLDGLILVIEDFYMKLTLLTVSLTNILYSLKLL